MRVIKIKVLSSPPLSSSNHLESLIRNDLRALGLNLSFQYKIQFGMRIRGLGIYAYMVIYP